MIPGLITRLRSLWRGIRRRSDVEAEMNEEFRLHLELRAQDLVRSGLTPAEAWRRASIEFGATKRYKEEARDARGLGLIDEIRFSWLDFKLGFRMLARYPGYPGLTLVGGLAFAFAIWVGAGMFEFLAQLVNPTLPLDEGHRIVALRNWDAAANRTEARALHDFVTWREELQSVDDLGAYRTLDRNLIVGENSGPVQALDGDQIADTPPDPSPVLYASHGGQNPCTDPSITVSGTSGGSPVSFTRQRDELLQPLWSRRGRRAAPSALHAGPGCTHEGCPGERSLAHAAHHRSALTRARVVLEPPMAQIRQATPLPSSTANALRFQAHEVQALSKAPLCSFVLSISLAQAGATRKSEATRRR